MPRMVVCSVCVSGAFAQVVQLQLYISWQDTRETGGAHAARPGATDGHLCQALIAAAGAQRKEVLSVPCGMWPAAG